MRKMLLLLALIAVPAWAADVAPAPTVGEPSAQTTQAVPKVKAKKNKAGKTETKAAATATVPTCFKQTCGGILGCYTRGCLSTCSPC